MVRILGMNECEFYRVVLGLQEPWEVTEVAVDAEKQKVEVTVACKAGTLWASPESRERLPVPLGPESVSGKSVGLFIGQALEHEPTHANVDMGFGVTDSFFIVAGQSSALVQPTEIGRAHV